MVSWNLKKNRFGDKKVTPQPLIESDHFGESGSQGRATDLHQPLGQGLRMQGPAKGLHLARMSYENALMRDEVLLSCYELKIW